MHCDHMRQRCLFQEGSRQLLSRLLAYVRIESLGHPDYVPRITRQVRIIFLESPGVNGIFRVFSVICQSALFRFVHECFFASLLKARPLIIEIQIGYFETEIAGCRLWCYY